MHWNSRVFPLLGCTVFSGPVQCHGIHGRFVSFSGSFLIWVLWQLWTWQQGFGKSSFHTLILLIGIYWLFWCLSMTSIPAWCGVDIIVSYMTLESGVSRRNFWSTIRTDPRHKSDCLSHQVTDPWLSDWEMATLSHMGSWSPISRTSLSSDSRSFCDQPFVSSRQTQWHMAG